MRAYDAYSNKVGSSENVKKERYYIEPQGFCVMAGIGLEEGNAEKALDSVTETSGDKIWYYDSSAGIYTVTIWNSGRFLPIRRDIKKMPVSSAIIIHGFPLRKLCLEEVTELLKFTEKSVRLILKISVKFTEQSHMFTHR